MTSSATRAPQFRLHVLFEIVAGCALLSATLVYQSLFLTWLVFAFLMVWAVRVGDLPLRWSLMSCFGGCSAIFLGLMCIHVAWQFPLDPYRSRQPGYAEYLAFVGPLISGCGLGFAIAGLVLTFRLLPGMRVIRESE